MQTLMLQLADSEVAAVRAITGGVQLRLSAARVRHQAPGGVRPVDGYAHHVLLEVADAALVAASAGLLGRIASGRVGHGDIWTWQIGLPCAVAGPVVLDVVFANGSQLVLQGRLLTCRFERDANFAESLMC